MKKAPGKTDIDNAYCVSGSIRGAARFLGISRRQVEKALRTGRYRDKEERRSNDKGKLKTISEKKLLEENDEETRGAKLLDMCLAQLGNCEYVSDSDMRRECRVRSESMWNRLCASRSGNIIVVGCNAKPKIFWGCSKSCENLVKAGKANFLDFNDRK